MGQSKHVGKGRIAVWGAIQQWCIRHPHWAALLSLMAAAILFYAPLLLGVATFPAGDFTDHFLPFSRFQLAALQQGQLPVWNPATYSGHPFLADTQAAVFYPLSNLLLLVTLPWSGSAARLYFLQVEAIVQIALAGFFVYLLVQRLTQNRWAGWLAGCSFAFSGYLTGYPPLQLAVLRTAIWLPLLLWLLDHAWAAPRRWTLWLAASLVAACAIFAGHPQTLLHTAYTVAAFCLFRLLSGELMLLRPRLNGLLLVVMLALALGAAQLLPSLEFASLSVRANVDYDFVSGGLPVQDFWQLLLPGVLTQFSPLYIGVIGFGLALLALFATLGPVYTPSERRHIYFFAALTISALLIAAGDHLPLYQFLYHFAPGWDLFRGQERVAFLVALGLSILAGYGAASIPRLALPARQRLALLISVIIALGVYGFGIFWQLLGRSAIGQGSYLLIVLVTVVVAGLLIVALRLPAWSSRRQGWIALAVLLNLWWANGSTNLVVGGPSERVALDPAVAQLATAVHARPTENLGLASRVYNEFRVYEDYAMSVGLEDLWGSSPLRLARYARLFDNFPLDRLWTLTGVEHLLTWRKELFEPSDLLAEFPQASDTTYLHRLHEPNPRAWLVGAIQAVDDTRAAELLADHTVDLAQVALLPSEDAIDATLPPPERAAAISLARPAPNRLRVQVTSEAGGILVISENWMPGWQISAPSCHSQSAITCDLTTPTLGLPPLQVQRANLTLIGVPVPAGAVEFEVRYWPHSVQLGLWISGSTGLLLVGLLLARWWWQRRRV